MEIVRVEKNNEFEKPVPTAWRSALKQLADKVVFGTEIKNQPDIEIDEIDSKTESSHRFNIESYADALGPLNDKTWETSIYIWDAPYWAILVDLSDVNGETTDLVLHTKVFETQEGYKIEPGLIFVP